MGISGKVPGAIGIRRKAAVKGKTIRVCGMIAISLFVWALTASAAQAATSPQVTTNPADDVTAHSVRLNGAVDPAGNGEVTSCQFEYGTTETYSLGAVPCEPATPYSNPKQVSADIASLTPEKTYHFRLVSANASPGSENHGGDQTFATSAATRNPIGSFGTASEPIAAGVDNSSEPSKGTVYVVGFGNDVEKFNEEGNPTDFSGLGSATLGGFANPPTAVAVDPTDGDILVVDEGDGAVTKYAPSGKPEEFSDKVDAYVNANTLSGTGSGGFAPFGIAVDDEGNIYVSNHATKEVDKFNSTGHFLLSFNGGVKYPFTGGPYNSSPDALAVDSSGDVYAVANRLQEVVKFNSSGQPIPADGIPGDTAVLASGGSQSVAVDPSNGETYVANGNTGNVEVYNSTGGLTDTIAFPGEGSYGMAVNGEKHRLYFANINDGNVRISPAIPGTPLADVGTGDATNVTKTSATLTGIVDPAGTGKITECYFDVNGKPNIPCEQPTPYSSSTGVTGSLSGLEPGTNYEYHLVAKSEEGGTNQGQADSVTTIAEPPALSGLTVTNVRSDIATLHGHIDANRASTTYHFEYVSDEQFQANGFAEATLLPIPDGEVGAGVIDVAESQQTGVLSAGTTYHFRLVATNSGGTSIVERVFITYSTGLAKDSCPNAHVRQQTGAAQLPDCRAYELVSAANTGGYAVESSLVAGQSPFGGYPNASGSSNTSRLLYGIHYGGISGIGDPTNKGVDPYAATRGEHGWSSEYVGIPASGTPSKVPFASSLLEANSTLESFAFGGEDICSPCFADGSSGIPLHLSSGDLVQGMAGSIPQTSATPDGYIARHFSADGTHFIFGSTSQFEPEGNSNGDVSIYDRNLKTGETHVVSNNPEGHALSCLQGAGQCHSPSDTNGIAELDVSKEGSRIVIAQKVGADAEGNAYWHLYMDVGDSPNTIDLTHGATDGVLFDGMTEDGSKVFFTTKDRLLAADTDSSADIYEAEVDSKGNVTLHLISNANADSCNPIANEERPHWNTVGAASNCDAVAIGGGGGIATTDGSIYFLSPELLDGPSKGTANQPNLYLARPGSAPRYITTLEANNQTVINSVSDPESFNYSDFQVTPSGDFAVFPSALSLTPTAENAGFEQVYRYDALGETLACVSCNPTGSIDTGDGFLSYLGLGLTNDGRVFFDSTQALAARDQDEKTDAYEWEARGDGTPECTSSAGCVGLISTGNSRFDSELLGVSSDGTDAFFFTRDTLVPQDENGTLAKIYDARDLGGFSYIPPPVPCKASDECHGPSSPTPPPPSFGTLTGSGGDYTEPSGTRTECKKGYFRKHGRCVKKNHGHKSHRKGHKRRG
jgi:hypothetical protein